MTNFRKPFIAPLAGAVLLGGCATYAPQPVSLSYFAVPCDTPGAIPATLIPPLNDRLGTTAFIQAPSPEPAAPATPASAEQPAPSKCLIAVADSGGRWRGASYDGGYPNRYSNPYGYYGFPIYGSFGVGVGGVRYRGRHHGGRGYSRGHAGGGHSAGAHGNGHGSGHH